MKSILVSVVAAVVLVGCGESQQSAPAPETPPAEPVAEVPAQPSSPQVEAELTEPVAEAAKPEPPAANAIDPWDKWLRSIHRAAQNGNIEDVKQHIAGGTDLNAMARGYTPLHNAAEFGRVGAGKKIAELLIAAGADVNAKDRYGETPLDAAKAYPETAALLRKHGAKTAEELKAEGK